MTDRNWLRELERPRAADAAGPLPPGIDASAIVSGIIDPDRLGTGAINAGTLVLHDDGFWRAAAGGGGVTLTQVELDFGATPVSSKKWTVAAAGTVATDKVVVLANGTNPTGHFDSPAEWDSICWAAVAGTGQITIVATVANGTTAGLHRVYYLKAS